MTKRPMEKSVNTAQQVIEIDDRQELLNRFEIQINKLNKTDLELLIQKLNFLCLKFDPFTAIEDAGNEAINILHELGLNHFLTNPFDFTHIVLQMLDLIDNKINTRVH